MSINFNTNPYYDDFDENKNFYRVLFKPGYAVQARELTQLQTALQNQIDKFGKHIFKEGSLVLGGQFNLETDVDTVRLTDSLTNTNLDSIVGKIIVGQTSGIRAYVHAVAYKNQWNETEDILMVRYLSSGTSSSVFIGGESLKYETTTNNVTTLSNINQTVKSISATGKGSLFTIQEGTVFTRGYFVSFTTQKIILSPTSQTPTGKVGFQSLEQIINSNQDATLLDPALGSYNYSAPGADRLKVSASLVLLDIDDDISVPEFTTLFIIKNGQMIEKYERTQYSKIYDEFAKRTFDESGDYVVRGLGVRVREHLDTGSNDGYLTLAQGGDVQKLAIGIEPGLAYVKGYEVNNFVTNYLPVEKSISTKNVLNEFLSARNGNYIQIEQVVGQPRTDIAQLITLYDTAETRKSNTLSTSTTTPIGNTIGTARVKSLEYNSADNYNLYLFDINMVGSNTFSDVKALGNTSSTGFFADIKTGAVIQDTTQAVMLYGLGSDYVANVRSDSSGSTDMSFVFKDIQNIVIGTSGNFSVTTDEDHTYGTSGTLSDTEKHTLVLTVNEDSNTTMTGTVTVVDSANTVTGSGTYFTRLNIGDKISVDGTTGVKIIKTITNDTLLTVEGANFSANVSGTTYNKIYQVGDIIDLTGKGATNGTERSVTVLSTNSLSFNLNETFDTTVNATLSYNASKVTVEQIDKELKPSRYVQINVNALSSTTDPVNLGISDVYRIRQIRQKTGSTFTSNTEGGVVTSNFILDNGQRDDFYDHAKIIPRASLQANTWLLIELDYFNPVTVGSPGYGYFSVESYPVNDVVESSTTIFTYQIPTYKSTYSGQNYKLRNYLDFRPVKTNSAADASTPSTATVNPGSSNSFNNNFSIPVPASQIVCDYYYYLARRDIVVSDINGNFSVITGNADIDPVSPTVPDNMMGIANLFIPPYPSLSTTYARILNKPNEGVTIKKVTNIRYTMRDIGVLKQRIENLEYYNALSLLEKKTVDLLIPDENGNDRFKNGFFVDGFLDHSLGSTYNSDYNIAIDKLENVIRPVFEMDSLTFNYNQLSSTNIARNGNLFTLPFTETLLLEQSRVTTIRNIEQSVFRFVGNISMNPDTDVWMDETTVDKTVEFGNDIPTGNIMTTEWGSWETYHTGQTVYNVYTRRFGDRSGDLSKAQLVGTFSSYADAVNSAASAGTIDRQDGSSRGYIETVTGGATRTGIQTTVNVDKSSQQIGSFVTDVSLIPYIRPQVIEVVVRGLKANTTYYTFFDGENMTNYVTPRVLLDEANVDPFPVAYQSEGTAWKTNSYGILVGLLRLPDTKRFRVGTKEIIITDSPTNAVDATSYAKNYFYASGVHTQKQNTILSTKTINQTTQTITETKVSDTKQKVDIFGPSCMAYSFKVDVPPTEPGIFLTSVDVFIKQVHPTLGVWFEIREMSSDGGITRTQVPYSEVWYTSAEVTTTSDATTPHNVKFPSPVFLQNNTQYALVIHTEGLNPDTYFWVSRLGETDIITNTPVTGRQLTGSLFTTNNNLNWDIVPDVDLKVKFYRASFNTSVVGNSVFGSKPYEFLTINSLNTFNIAGETIQSSQILTLGNVSATLYVGNTITQGSNTTSIIAIDGSKYYTNGFSFVSGSITYDAGTATVDDIDTASAKLVKHTTNGRMLLDDSNGKFFTNAVVVGATSGKSGIIASIDEFVYSTVNFKPRYLNLQNTATTLAMSGIMLSSNTFADYKTFTPDTSYEFEDEYTIKSRTTEVNNFASANSVLIKASFYTNSEYTSPIIDLSATHNVFIRNIVNANTVNEDMAFGGELINKYISKIVTLADGQDAEDMIVKIKAYRPPTTDVKVWMKIKHSEDGQEFALRPWIELTRDGNEAYSSLVNKSDYIDYTYVVPAAMMGVNNGPVEYTASNGAIFIGFKQFSIKIGLLATNTSIVPKVGDLRAIALQK